MLRQGIVSEEVPKKLVYINIYQELRDQLMYLTGTRRKTALLTLSICLIISYGACSKWMLVFTGFLSSSDGRQRED